MIDAAHRSDLFREGLRRVRGRNSSDASTSWWDVVPQMRERFNAKRTPRF